MGYSRLPSTLSSKLPTVHFGVPAVLTRHDHDNPEFKYQFQFFHSEYEERQVAVLSPVMVTALTVEGDKEATWDEVEPLLILGCIVTLDVSLGPKDEIWNVFGLYFGLEKSQVFSLHKKEECDGMSVSESRRKFRQKERSVDSGHSGIPKVERCRQHEDGEVVENKCFHHQEVGVVMEEQHCQQHEVGVVMEKYSHHPEVGVEMEEQCRHQHEVGVVVEDQLCHQTEEGVVMEKCCHQHEVVVVMTTHTPDNLLQLGACVDEDWVWSSVDPLNVPVYCGGQRIREGLSVRTGNIGTLVSCQCVLCHHNNNTVLQQPALLWFGVGSHAPCVRASPGVVVEKGVVQLDEDRKAWCEGVDDIGSRVLVWGWGGKDDNRAVRGVAVVPGGVALEHGGEAEVNGNMAVEHGGVPGIHEAVAVVHGEEERYQSSVEKKINVTGKEADFVMDDFFTQIYFSSLVWRLAREEPEMFKEEMERRWKVLCEDLEETRVFKEDCDQVANQRPLKQLFLEKEELLENKLLIVPRMKSMNYNPSKSMGFTLDSILEEEEMDDEVDGDYPTNNDISDYNANLPVRGLWEFSRTSFNLPSILEECDY